MYNSNVNIKNIIQIGSECIIADFIHLINEYYFDKLKINYDSCCLSVPDFYTPLQRQKLKLICETIGMNNVKIYDESLAITMYYGYSKYKEIFVGNEKDKIEKKVLFIDIGHSKTSFILSIFKYNEFIVENVLSNPNLGGRNIELLLYEYCIKEFGIEESNVTNKMRFRLIEEINKKVKHFSISDEIEIKVDSFYEDDDLELIIKEDTFIKIINDKIIKVIEELCDEIKSYMEINKIEIDSVECSGELIRIKKLQEIFLKKGFVIPDDINETGVSRTLLIDECASVGAALLDNFICGKCPYKDTLKKIIYEENKENNKDYSNNDLKKIILFINEQDEKEKLYDNFTEMKNEYKKYIYNLQKIDSVDDNIEEKLENLQSTLQNFEFKTQKDINDMKMIYDEIVFIAKNIIDSLIKKSTNDSNDCNVLIVDLLKIKEDLSHKSEFNNDKETIYKRLEDIYLNNWQK
jgi:DNA-directed RNA polymerase subunit M/transcription elongation factor TFIIS